MLKRAPAQCEDPGLSAMRNVAIVSIGSKTESHDFVTKKVRDLPQHIQIMWHDVRDDLKKNPRHSELVRHDLDGTSPITQRSVIGQPAFAVMIKKITKKVIEPVDADFAVVLVLECTSGGHRAFTSASVEEEVLNSLHLNGVQFNNAQHFPMAWLQLEGQLINCWDNVAKWAVKPWLKKTPPGLAMQDKFGYEGAMQREEAFAQLKKIWNMVSEYNTGEVEPTTSSASFVIL